MQRKTNENWVESQKTTFTNWANRVLGGLYKLTDIETDFNDGLILIMLFEQLRKMKMTVKYNQQPKSEIHKIENCENALNFIKEDDVKLVNIGAKDIVDGNLRLILGLLWTLIQKYQIGKDGQNATRKGLIDWVNEHLTEMKVNDFSQSWSDGTVLCNLTNTIRPGTVDVEHEEMKKGNLERVRYVQQMAFEKLHIPIVMPAEHIACEQPDELSLMLYVSYFRMRPEELNENEKNDAEEVDMRKKCFWYLVMIVAFIGGFINFYYQHTTNKK